MNKKKSIIGFTTGVFDMFHIGHLNIIKNAKAKCDHLIIGVTTDKLCAELKNKQPIVPYSERVEIIEALRDVDKVVPQHNIDEIADWERYRFNRIFKGGDWKGSEKWNKLEKEFKALNVEVIFFDYTETTSSTELREKLMHTSE